MASFFLTNYYSQFGFTLLYNSNFFVLYGFLFFRNYE